MRSFAAFNEAVELANGTPYGIQAGIYTRDIGTTLAAVEVLDFAGVAINEAANFRVDQMPYGGVKASGNTREGPHYAVRETTEECLVVVRKLGPAPLLKSRSQPEEVSR
jgi:acyl-CoA reductase-like NAD-dependent aldehyde dehydrogenase